MRAGRRRAPSRYRRSSGACPRYRRRASGTAAEFSSAPARASGRPGAPAPTRSARPKRSSAAGRRRLPRRRGLANRDLLNQRGEPVGKARQLTEPVNQHHEHEQQHQLDEAGRRHDADPESADGGERPRQRNRRESGPDRADENHTVADVQPVAADQIDNPDDERGADQPDGRHAQDVHEPPCFIMAASMALRTMRNDTFSGYLIELSGVYIDVPAWRRRTVMGHSPTVKPALIRYTSASAWKSTNGRRVRSSN